MTTDEYLEIALYGAYDRAPTGPTRVTNGLASSLAGLGHDVNIITNGTETEHPLPGIQVTNVPIEPNSVYDFWRVHRWVRSYIETKHNTFDVFHSLAGYSYGADVNTVQGFLMELDLIRFARPALPDTRTLVGGMVYSLLKLRGIRKCKSVVTTSPVSDRQLRSYGRITPDEMIPLGIDEDWLVAPTYVNSPIRILFAGRVEPRKGQQRVLAHLDPQATEYQVDIVGGVKDEDYYQLFHARWSHRYHGHVDEIRLRDFYKLADIVVLPSYHETFGLVALEAIASGSVLVIMDTCGFAQLPESNEEHGIFVVKDGKEAAATVHNLCGRTDLMELKKRAHDLARTMTWAKIAERYEELYLSTVQSG